VNIFFLDRNIQKCVEYHNDKHVVKMILEYAQLLCTTHQVLGSTLDKSTLYKQTHTNHPCAVWVRSNKLHYEYLYSLFQALCSEYTYRYGKVHATARLLPTLRVLPTFVNESAPCTPPQCMPDECQVDGDTVRAYREYYISSKSHIATWSKREVPSWWK
jgi:Pyrimidine dimer DNA glycosylase